LVHLRASQFECQPTGKAYSDNGVWSREPTV
jgi:hypothetical protein